MANKTDERKLDREILADAEAQSQRNIKKAKREAQEILEHAHNEAQAQSKAILDAAHERAQTRTAIAKAGIEVEANRLALITRENTVQIILDEALRLSQDRNTSEYPAALAALGVEAISKMTSEAFVIGLNANDTASIGESLLKTIAEKVQQQYNRDVALKLNDNPPNITTGIIVQSQDGGQRVDNSFAQRRKRNETRLRLETAKIIFPNEDGK